MTTKVDLAVAKTIKHEVRAVAAQWYVDTANALRGQFKADYAHEEGRESVVAYVANRLVAWCSAAMFKTDAVQRFVYLAIQNGLPEHNRAAMEKDSKQRNETEKADAKNGQTKVSEYLKRVAIAAGYESKASRTDAEKVLLIIKTALSIVNSKKADKSMDSTERAKVTKLLTATAKAVPAPKAKAKAGKAKAPKAKAKADKAKADKAA